MKKGILVAFVASLLASAAAADGLSLLGSGSGSGSGVTSFNTRTGAVSLTSADVTTACPTCVLTTGTNTVALSVLQQQATNTVLVNATSGTANVTAQNVGSCSTAASALIWTTNTGFGCNSAINAAQLGGATFASPGAIGGTSAGAGTFTTLAATTSFAATGTTNVAPASGTLGLTGTAALPTMAATAEGSINLATLAGLQIMGDGTNSDVGLYNKNGTAAITIPTGTQNVSFLGNIIGNTNASAEILGGLNCGSANTNVTLVPNKASTTTGMACHSTSGDWGLVAGGTEDMWASSTLVTYDVGWGFASVLCSPTAPTISSGFGTSPSIVFNNGTCSFQVNVGTGGAASSGVVGLPAATNGWHCHADDVTTNSTSVFLTRQTATSTTTATFTNFNTAGTATAWVASDKLEISCEAA